ncbi:Ig-like domain-containing protein, partial [Harryflintia acetispora]|uniref:Ig-like domain-containing protein n=1 Tax=Harryflintia acetispora TaxID=1849041 RepID=UPI001898FB46
FTLSAALTGGVSSDELEWTNSNPGAAAMTVSADGRSATIDASGKTAGSTTITAHIKGAPDTAQYKASCTVTVVTINSLTMNPTSYTLYVPGPPQTVQLTATVTPNAAPVWSSSNPSAATVNETGLVTAVAPGSAIVTASVGGKSASCAITVKDRIAVTSVTVSGNNNLVRTSDNLSPTSQLSATTDPPNVTFPAVTWAKTGGSASININASGLVTATAAGTATFTATVDGMTSAPYTVTVTDQKVTGITIAQKSVDKGGTVQMSATVSPANALNRNITWSLASGNVASISAAGLVTGGVGGNGTITVRASAADGSGVSGTGTVTVNGCEHALSAGGYGSGAGTSGKPWIVASAGQLQHVNSHLAGHFRQSANIDLSSYGQWTPIGNFVSGTIDAPFTGLYDGNGKIITGCKINGGFLRGSLFGCVSGSGAGVKNLSAQNFTINVSNVNTSDTSAVVNYLMNGAVVSGCRVLNSTLTCHYSGASIVAAIYGNSRVENCYADDNTITGTSVGGITSWMQENGAIKNCFSYSNRLTANGGALGGIAAQTFSGSPALSGNYFLNSTASYGGGNPLTNTGATPLAAAAFNNSASFSGWDFSTVWYMPANGNYPMLRHFTQ